MKTWQEHVEAAESVLDKANDRTTAPGTASMLCHLAAKHIKIANLLLDVDGGGE